MKLTTSLSLRGYPEMRLGKTVEFLNSKNTSPERRSANNVKRKPVAKR